MLLFYINFGENYIFFSYSFQNFYSVLRFVRIYFENIILFRANFEKKKGFIFINFRKKHTLFSYSLVFFFMLISKTLSVMFSLISEKITFFCLVCIHYFWFFVGETTPPHLFKFCLFWLSSLL